MKVPDSEVIARHAVPESCVADREVRRMAAARSAADWTRRMEPDAIIEHLRELRAG